MTQIAHLSKERPGEAFEAFRHSRFGGNPVLPTSVQVATPPRCAVCQRELLFLMQLATPYKHDVDRVLVIYFCPEHSEASEGWSIYRYTMSSSVPGIVASTSAFDEMNALSSWVSDIDLVPSSHVGDHIANDSSNAYRVIVEEDFINPALEFKGIDDQRLYQSYRHRNRSELDEEDHMDFDQLDSMANTDDESSMDSDPEDMIDTILMEFQHYVSLRPSSVLRYDWSGIPLLLERTAPPAITCKGCNGPVTFEFQLLPPFTKYITHHITRRAAMHIASVLFYTCRNDCITASSGIQEHACVMLYV